MNIRHTLKRLIAGPDPEPVLDLGRNDRCWCNSGRKYKACHLLSDERKRSAARAGSSPRVGGRGF